MKEIIVNGRSFVLYVENKDLQEAIRKIALEIREDYKGKDPLLVCVMNGCFMFAGELMSYIDEAWEIDFARYSSYEGTSSTMELKERMPITASIKDRDVIIVEDLIDTGYTMDVLKKKYLAEGARSVKIATMLCKPEAVKTEVRGDYVAMNIEDKFIVGHGLDYDGYGRMLADIYQIKD